MLSLLAMTMVASAWGWTSPHHDVAFLHTASAPVEEAMGPNLNFAPLSTTMKCTINLTIQYMLIFTALGIMRTYLDFQGQSYETNAAAKALKHASETVFYAPMACLLFVGFRMRVLQLTKGTGNPPEYVQMGMQCVAYSILANTLMVMIIPVFVKGADVELDEKTGEMKMDGANPFENTALAAVFTAVRYGCFLALYVGFGVVVYGLYTFEPPAGVWVEDGKPLPVPPLSPAVFCTCMLACAFFTCYCFLAISRTYSQFTVGNTKETTFETTMIQGANTLALAPMFCVLFLGARMRALQMDPVHGHPQPWAQNCFYMCSWALVVQCILAIAIPLTGVGSVSKGMVEGDLELKVGEEGSMLAKVLTFVRWVIMVCIYVGACAVVSSVFTIVDLKLGKEGTPPISPTMQCVINLSWQYFTIYILVWAFATWEHFTTWRSAWTTTLKDAVASAKTTVEYAPMLCVLFIATRMRALQITQNKGAPQGYVQDGMYLASWAVLIQFTMCLIMPFMTGEKFEVRSLAGTGAHDKPIQKDQIKNYWGGMAVQTIRYLAVIALMGGTAAVITGVCLMTPENANGRGSIPLVGDYVEPAPMATDLPGMEAAMKTSGTAIGESVDVVHDAGETAADGVADVSTAASA